MKIKVKPKTARVKARVPKPRVSRPIGDGLDAGAKKHLGLLLDPCNAPLTYPAYSDSGGGYLVRMRRLITVGGNAGETAGYIQVIPGLNVYFANGAATALTTFNPSHVELFPSLSTQGNANSGRSYRCVAGCVRAYVNASELNRSGLAYATLWTGNQLAEDFTGAGTTNLTDIIARMPAGTRAPSKALEAIWLPNEQDAAFQTSYASTTPTAGAEGNAAVCIGFTGAASGTGYTFELTFVYEVMEGFGSNVITTRVKPASTTPWVKVLDAAWSALRNSPVVSEAFHTVKDYAIQAGTSYLGQVVPTMAMLAV